MLNALNARGLYIMANFKTEYPHVVICFLVCIQFLFQKLSPIETAVY